MTHENAARSGSDVADLVKSTVSSPDTPNSLTAGYQAARKASDRTVKKLENAKSTLENGKKSLEETVNQRVSSALNIESKAKERARQFGRSFGNPFGF